MAFKFLFVCYYAFTIDSLWFKLGLPDVLFVTCKVCKRLINFKGEQRVIPLVNTVFKNS